MLQQDKPDDFVLATGETHPVREFVEKSFHAVGIELKYALRSNLYSTNCFLMPRHCFRWSGKGVDEQAIDVKTGKVVVKVDAGYFRPAEVECVTPYFFTAQHNQHSRYHI